MRKIIISVTHPKTGFEFVFYNKQKLCEFLNVDFEDIKFDNVGFCNVKGLILLDLKKGFTPF